MGSIDFDSTFTHEGTDTRHDTPEKLVAANGALIEWAKELDIREVVSGSNRQCVTSENRNREEHTKRKYSGSSLHVLREFAKQVGANFDGILLADVSNGYQPGTHCQYLLSADAETYHKEPEDFVPTVGLSDNSKRVLIRLQVEHFVNKYKDNPFLKITLHFVDDKEAISVELREFYQCVLTLLPSNARLQLWHRNPVTEHRSAIQPVGEAIQFQGVCDRQYLKSTLYFFNYSKEYCKAFYTEYARECFSAGKVISPTVLDDHVVSLAMKWRLNKFFLAKPALGALIPMPDNKGGTSLFIMPLKIAPGALVKDDFDLNGFLIWRFMLELKELCAQRKIDLKQSPNATLKNAEFILQIGENLSPDQTDALSTSINLFFGLSEEEVAPYRTIRSSSVGSFFRQSFTGEPNVDFYIDMRILMERVMSQSRALMAPAQNH